MTDYTPTTEEVRNAYIEDEFGIPRESHLIPGFERWLASVQAEAWREGYAAAEIHLHPVSMAEAPPINPHETETEND